MEELRLGVIESQFAEIIWSNEPLPSGELVKLCEQKLGWKKSTTYTVPSSPPARSPATKSSP